MNEYIPLSVPSLKDNEWQYVKECLDTEWMSSAGKYVDKFEKMRKWRIQPSTYSSL